MHTVLGTILLLSPFLLVFIYENKTLAFVRILTFLFALHLSIAILTQSLHMFSYRIVLTINALVCCISFAIFFISLGPRISNYIKGVKANSVKPAIDWIRKASIIPVLFVVILFVDLRSVHHNYSGKYSVAVSSGYKEAKNMKYVYPYFADEWYAIAFIKDIIVSRSLPFSDPLLRGIRSLRGEYRVMNLQFPFHCLLSELVLLLGLNPLTEYTALAVFFGITICILVYILLRVSGLGSLPASLAGLAVLYITNGANLPGIWNLIPITFGAICMLESFIFISARESGMFLMASFLALIFYPALAPFCVLGAVFYYSRIVKLSAGRLARGATFFAAAIILSAAIISMSYFAFERSLFKFIKDALIPKIFYSTFTPGAIPQFTVFHIVPVLVLTLAALGLPKIIRERAWLGLMMLLGSVYWAAYSFTTVRVLIDYERVVFFTSVLITAASGFGIDAVLRFASERGLVLSDRRMRYLNVAILVVFLAASPYYTGRSSWQALKLKNIKTGEIFLPAAPANRYLDEDDLRVFKGVKYQNFLSLPWKGTVISIATDNYPRSSKPGTVTANYASYPDFVNAHCRKKYKIAAYGCVDYVYSSKFECPYFEYIDMSLEGLYLYKFNKRHAEVFIPEE